jgi:hypothetical protein
MAIYFDGRVLNDMEIDALLSAWPCTNAEGTVAASHADLVAEIDFSASPAAVTAEISSALAAKGVTAAEDAIAPKWVVVTLPSDVKTGDDWETLWEDAATSIVVQHTGDFVEKVVDNYVSDEKGSATEPLTIETKTGAWRIRDREDRWLGPNGHLSRLDKLL